MCRGSMLMGDQGHGLIQIIIKVHWMIFHWGREGHLLSLSRSGCIRGMNHNNVKCRVSQSFRRSKRCRRGMKGCVILGRMQSMQNVSYVKILIRECMGKSGFFSGLM